VAVAPGPEPDRAALLGVACAAPSTCFAVGGLHGPADFADDHDAPVLREGDGHRWREIDAVAAAGPPGAAGGLRELRDIACAGGACLAVGRTGAVVDDLSSYALRWDGTSWARAADPPTILRQVACLRADRCLGLPVAFADGNVYVWDAAAGWAVGHAVGDGSGGRATAVTCVPGASCLVLGGRLLSAAPVGVVWDGTTWTDGPGAELHQVDALSCASATDCLAVGQGVGGYAANTWDGTSWAPAAAPADPVVDVLGRHAGLACRAEACVLVGAARYPGTGTGYADDPQRPSVQRYARR
jgi:hypothetical protein